MLRKIKDSLKNIDVIKNIVYDFKRKFLKEKGDNAYKYYNYPWLTDYEQRINELKQAKQQKKKTIVYIHDKPDPLTFRYRAYNHTQILNKSEQYSGHYFFEYELGKLITEINNIDLLIFIRIGWSYEAVNLIDKLHLQKKKVGFDTDDYVFDVDHISDLIEQLAVPEKDHGFYFYYVSRIYNLAKHADFFTCTNEFLQQKIEKFFKKPCYVIPNYLNDEQIAKSEEILKTKNIKNKNVESITIGYFSGTKTHDRDFSLVADALAKIMNENDDVNLLLVGHLELPEVLEPLKHRITRKGLTDYLTLMEYIANVDVNIAPLVINDFTNCKSELKFFDAGIVKTATIASPTFAFEKAIKDGKNGLLAKDDEWEKKLKELINTGETRKQLAGNARQTSLENYYNEKIVKILLNTLKNLI